jgi:neutral ceramidase
MSPTNFKAGVAKEEITPSIGIRTYYGRSTEIDLPLFTKALVLDDGKQPIALCTNDLIRTDLELVTQARSVIEKNTGLPGQNLLFSASHTHEGPRLEGDYRNQYLQKLIDVVCTAWETRVPARIGTAIGALIGVHINRRNFYGPADPDVSVIRVDQRSKAPLALFFTFAMHGVVLGHRKYQGISPDWIGHATRQIEKEQGSGSIALFAQGPSGNINPYTSIGYTGFTNKGGTVEEAERIGKLLGLFTTVLADQIQTTSNVRLSCATSYQRLWAEKSFDVFERYQRILAHKKQSLQLLEQQKSPQEEIQRQKIIISFLEEYGDLYFAANQSRPRRENPEKSEIQVLGINDTRIIGLGGEYFNEYSLYIKEHALNMGYKNVIIAELANGAWWGYIPTEVAFQYEHGYSVFNAEIMSGLDPKAGQRIADTALQLIMQCGHPIEPPPTPITRLYLPNGEAYAVMPVTSSRLDRLRDSLPLHHELRMRRHERIRNLPN